MSHDSFTINYRKICSHSFSIFFVVLEHRSMAKHEMAAYGNFTPWNLFLSLSGPGGIVGQTSISCASYCLVGVLEKHILEWVAWVWRPAGQSWIMTYSRHRNQPLCPYGYLWGGPRYCAIATDKKKHTKRVYVLQRRIRKQRTLTWLQPLA